MKEHEALEAQEAAPPTGRVESISVVIPTYRRPEALRVTIAALMSSQLSAARLELIVVDDGADESTATVVRQCDGARLSVRYASQHRRGAATARNHGARLADGDLLIFCDDDVIVEPDHLRRHLAAREVFDEPLVNGVSVLVDDTLSSFRATAFGRLRLGLERRYDDETDGRSLGQGRFEAALLSARNLAVGRETFWAIGGFDEGFPHAGAEDQDLSLRARRAGCLLLRDHAIRVAHNEQTLTLEQFCGREERSSQTVVMLARKFPEEGAKRALLADNGLIARTDRAPLVLKKLVKWVLARDRALNALHRAIRLSEGVSLPETVRHRLYLGLIGLHIFRGVRTGLRGNRHLTPDNTA